MTKAKGLIGAAVCLAAAGCLSAQEPVRNIQDLVGRNQSNGDNQMAQRGFRFVRVENSGSNSYKYFREERSNRCVTVHVENNRYQSLVYASDLDCERRGQGGGGGRQATGLQDLVGARGRDGEFQLQQRGYVMDRSEDRGNARVMYYRKGNECVEIEVADGRYSYLNDVPRRNCSGGAGSGGGWANGGSSIGNAPRVNVDTDGRGDFSSDRVSGRVTRGFVNTTGDPSLGFRVDGRVVTFYGRIEREISNREFEMRINRSSEGNVNGNATFRLNGDRNEVEMISVSGTMNGRSFSGNFRR